MKKTMKAIAFAAFTTLAATLMTGCGSETTAATTAAQATTQAETTTAPATTQAETASTSASTASDDINLVDGNFTIGIGQFAVHGSLDNCREGFIEGLAEEGFIEGKNLTIIRKCTGRSGTCGPDFHQLCRTECRHDLRYRNSDCSDFLQRWTKK